MMIWGDGTGRTRDRLLGGTILRLNTLLLLSSYSSAREKRHIFTTLDELYIFPLVAHLRRGVYYFNLKLWIYWLKIHWTVERMAKVCGGEPFDFRFHSHNIFSATSSTWTSERFEVLSETEKWVYFWNRRQRGADRSPPCMLLYTILSLLLWQTTTDDDDEKMMLLCVSYLPKSARVLVLCGFSRHSHFCLDARARIAVSDHNFAHAFRFREHHILWSVVRYMYQCR